MYLNKHVLSCGSASQVHSASCGLFGRMQKLGQAENAVCNVKEHTDSQCLVLVTDNARNPLAETALLEELTQSARSACVCAGCRTLAFPLRPAPG